MHTTRADLDHAAARVTPRGVERGVGIGALLGRLGLPAQPVRCGRFVLLRKLGEGAMGEVYRAHDPELRRDVAIKLLHGDEGAPGDDGVGARLRGEARALARLAHPHVVPVLAIGREDARTWIAMELVVGTSLARWCEAPRDAAGDRRALEILRAAALGLAAAHAAGLVHRDFKPANVLVGDDGRVKVADFGLARLDATASTDADPVASSGGLEASHGRATTMVGTPRYMAPEQALGRVADARSDQFAFGVTAWEVLTGEVPFGGRTPAERIAAFAGGPPSRSAARLPRRLRALLRRCLALAPEQRFASMAELLAAWDRATAGPRPRAWVIAAVALVAATGGVALAPSVHAAACDGDGARRGFAAVWNPSRQARVAAAMRGTEVPWAEDAITDLEATLVQQGARWIAADVAACEAARRDADAIVVLEQQRGCFEHAMSVTHAWLSRLEDATPSSVERAVASAHALPDPGACESERGGTGARARRAPGLDEAAAAQLAGEYDRAFARAGEVAEAAARDGDPQLEAEALLAGVRAELERSTLDVEPPLQRAHGLAIAEDAHGLAFDVAMTATLWHANRGHADEAARWLRHAEASGARLPPSTRREAARGRARCAVLEAQGRLEPALAACDEALAILDGADEPDPTLRERLRGAIQGLHYALGHYEVALAQALALRDEAQADRGPSHPRTGGMHLNVGRAAQALGQYALAESSALRAAEIFRAAYGEHHRWVVSAWMNLGSLRQAQGDAAGAEAAARSALAACGERRDAATARVLHNLAEARRSQGRPDEALALLERVASIEGEVLPGGHLQGAWTLHSRGNALLDLGRLDEAERALTEARALLTAAGTTDLAALDESTARLARLRDGGS